MRLRVSSPERTPASDGEISGFEFEKFTPGTRSGGVTFHYRGNNRRYLAHEHGKWSGGQTDYSGPITMTVEEICELFAFVTKKAPISKEWRQVSRALVAEIQKGGQPD